MLGSHETHSKSYDKSVSFLVSQQIVNMVTTIYTIKIKWNSPFSREIAYLNLQFRVFCVECNFCFPCTSIMCLCKPAYFVNKMIYSVLAQHQYIIINTLVLATCFGFYQPSSDLCLLYGGTFSVRIHWGISQRLHEMKTVMVVYFLKKCMNVPPYSKLRPEDDC